MAQQIEEMRDNLKRRLTLDRTARIVMIVLTVFSGVLVFLIAFGLFQRSLPILKIKSLGELLFSSSWRPSKGDFGFFPFIMGTLFVTGAAMAIAVPFSLLTSIYLSEYAYKRIRVIAAPMIDLLAGIPSVVYGVWGILVIVPFVKNIVAPFFGTFSTGYTVLSAAIVLAIMILPIIIHISGEVLQAVPDELRDASLSLGATKWQTVKHVVLRKALPGIVAAVVLGLSRAFGETMAVLMVAGNVSKIPTSLLSPAYPLPALIANNYGEMLSIPLYDSALLFAALLLFAVVVFFNMISKLILIRIERSIR